MKLSRFVRITPVVAAVLGVMALWLTGCSRSVTRPEGASSSLEATPSPSKAPDVAPITSVRDLGVGASATPADLAGLLTDQPKVEALLRQVAPGLLGTAVSMHGNRPVVLALTNRPMAGLPGRIGVRDIEELVVGDVQAQSYYCGTSTGRADECNAGTLGAIVTDGLRNYWLSNWHVLVDTQGRAGDAIVAPGRVDVSCGNSTTVGALSRFVAVRFDGSTNRVDCAIAAIAAGTSVSALEAGGSRSFLPSGTIRAASLGLPVKKIGRTTGYTTGTIVGINGTFSVQYGTKYAKFAGVVICSPMSNNGDSGSLICTQSGNNPVALLFAGSSKVSLGCPIADVFQAVGAHVAN